MVWLDDVRECRGAVALDRRIWNERDGHFPLHQQPRIDELIWKKRFVLVRHRRAQLESAGRLVDLVVDCCEVAARQRGLHVAIERIDRKTTPRPQRAEDCSELL